METTERKMASDDGSQNQVSNEPQPEHLSATFQRYLDEPVDQKEERELFQRFVSHWRISPKPWPGPESTCASDATPLSTRSYASLASRPSRDETSEPPENCFEEHLYYRQDHLQQNGIFLHWSPELPGHVAQLVAQLNIDRAPPSPSLDEADEVKIDPEYLGIGAIKSNPRGYFLNRFFPCPGLADPLRRKDQSPMAHEAMPSSGRTANKVSPLVPDLLYGYNISQAFNDTQQTLLRILAKIGASPFGNGSNFVYPFLAIEFVGDGPGSADGHWVATNKCLGSAASCVNIAERLRMRLEDTQSLDTTAFAMVVTPVGATLYACWKDDSNYYMQVVDYMPLFYPQSYLKFRRYILNIVDWGRDRLKDIQAGLDSLLSQDDSEEGSPPRKRQRTASPSESS